MLLIKKIVPLYLMLGHLYGTEGYSVSLFDHALNNCYETKNDGFDTSVLKIYGIRDFYQRVTKNTGPTIVKMHSSSSLVSQKTETVFWDLSEKYPNIEFASIDLVDNKELMDKFTSFFVKLALTSQANGKPINSKLMVLVKALISLQRVPNSTPFVIFFNDGYLIFPNTLDFTQEETFALAINQQLLNPPVKQSSPSIGVWKMGNEKKPDKTTVWGRFKSKINKWWQ